jgi:hypothetical protein
MCAGAGRCRAQRPSAVFALEAHAGPGRPGALGDVTRLPRGVTQSTPPVRAQRVPVHSAGSTEGLSAIEFEAYFLEVRGPADDVLTIVDWTHRRHRNREPRPFWGRGSFTSWGIIR